MKRKNIAKILAPFVCCVVFFYSCEKESALDKYYNQPGTFSGSIYAALDSSGLYEYFLEGIDSTEFTNKLKNTLVSVVVPSDEAFKTYFEKEGYSDISSIPTETLQDLISNHVITWPQSPATFENDPLLFKRLSNMVAREVTKYDLITNSYRSVISEPKYLQFYTPFMLNFYGGNTDDYTLLTGVDFSSATGFNINDAKVENIQPYGNGWVYFVDKVMEPIKDLDEWLMDDPEYSLFSDLFNRFSLYYDDDDDYNINLPYKRSNVFQNQRSYRIDMELCFETVVDVTGGRSNTLNASSGFTVIAPKNNGLNEFIETYFADYPEFRASLYTYDKSSMEILHYENIIRAIISPYLFLTRLVFPSNFASEDGEFSYDGTNFKLQDQDISEYAFCSNGYGYGIDKFEIPRTFKSILRPIFTSPDYTYFAAAIFEARALGYLNDENNVYTLMLPTDDAFRKQNIELIDVVTYNDLYAGEDAVDEIGQTFRESIFVQHDTVLNEASIVDKQALFALIFDHLFTEDIVPTAETQHKANSLGNYVAFNETNIWSGGNMEERWYYVGETLFEREPGIPNSTGYFPPTFVDNGKVYVIDNLIKSASKSIGETIFTNPEFSVFKSICENAGLLVGEDLAIYGNFITGFIPTNAVLNQFITDGNLPSNEDDLQNFIKYFFVDLDLFSTQTVNTTTETLSVDIELSTDFYTAYRTLEVNGIPGDLKIKGINNATEINVIEGKDSNIICEDGIIHLIDGVLN